MREGGRERGRGRERERKREREREGEREGGRERENNYTALVTREAQLKPFIPLSSIKEGFHYQLFLICLSFLG